MTEYKFERECRTPHSEAYLIISNNERLGRVDLHFTPSIVYATVCVTQNLTQEAIDDLIDVIDEELVMSADVARDDFIVTVYQGREVGVFSDEDFEDDED
ncbi:MAG: hypothetical protein A2Y59_03065 [Chloroflexi bacterium RBG_13_52_14]|nr:MAG: hypothetical protein A2Y59_03065 [Chloroflexi bacterium RBG_13_52_14]